jgi:hypothetical protein
MADVLTERVPNSRARASADLEAIAAGWESALGAATRAVDAIGEEGLPPDVIHRERDLLARERRQISALLELR